MVALRDMSLCYLPAPLGSEVWHPICKQAARAEKKLKVRGMVFHATFCHRFGKLCFGTESTSSQMHVHFCGLPNGKLLHGAGNGLRSCYYEITLKIVKDFMHGRFVSVSGVSEIIIVPMPAKMAANPRHLYHGFSLA